MQTDRIVLTSKRIVPAIPSKARIEIYFEPADSFSRSSIFRPRGV